MFRGKSIEGEEEKRKFSKLKIFLFLERLISLKNCSDDTAVAKQRGEEQAKPIFRGFEAREAGQTRPG